MAKVPRRTADELPLAHVIPFAGKPYRLTPRYLLAAEIAEKQARSIKYQITIAKLPLAKDIDDFAFDRTPVNETLRASRGALGGG